MSEMAKRCVKWLSLPHLHYRWSAFTFLWKDPIWWKSLLLHCSLNVGDGDVSRTMLVCSHRCWHQSLWTRLEPSPASVFESEPPRRVCTCNYLIYVCLLAQRGQTSLSYVKWAEGQHIYTDNYTHNAAQCKQAFSITSRRQPYSKLTWHYHLTIWFVFKLKQKNVWFKTHEPPSTSR